MTSAYFISILLYMQRLQRKNELKREKDFTKIEGILKRGEVGDPGEGRSMGKGKKWGI